MLLRRLLRSNQTQLSLVLWFDRRLSLWSARRTRRSSLLLNRLPRFSQNFLLYAYRRFQPLCLCLQTRLVPLQSRVQRATLLTLARNRLLDLKRTENWRTRSPPTSRSFCLRLVLKTLCPVRIHRQVCLYSMLHRQFLDSYEQRPTLNMFLRTFMSLLPMRNSKSRLMYRMTSFRLSCRQLPCSKPSLYRTSRPTAKRQVPLLSQLLRSLSWSPRRRPNMLK